MSLREAAKDSVIPLSAPITNETGEQIHEVRVKKGQVIVVNSAGYNL
jgi:hypothetical protein